MENLQAELDRLFEKINELRRRASDLSQREAALFPIEDEDDISQVPEDDPDIIAIRQERIQVATELNKMIELYNETLEKYEEAGGSISEGSEERGLIIEDDEGSGRDAQIEEIRQKFGAKAAESMREMLKRRLDEDLNDTLKRTTF